ncbi:MbtH family protein [Streptosporangium sp. NPDC020072]|uniref:MbtH family protein n=1 Tax=Streptosporangium jomthongense TaxID=1193683 RepID=A0ABV8FDZ7_9ACTN
MSNPFEDEDGRYLVLVNGEGQHSLWPFSQEIPRGWEVALGESSRRDCLEFVEANWTDMRPRGLSASREGLPAL